MQHRHTLVPSVLRLILHRQHFAPWPAQSKTCSRIADGVLAILWWQKISNKISNSALYIQHGPIKLYTYFNWPYRCNYSSYRMILSFTEMHLKITKMKNWLHAIRSCWTFVGNLAQSYYRPTSKCEIPTWFQRIRKLILPQFCEIWGEFRYFSLSFCCIKQFKYFQ